MLGLNKKMRPARLIALLAFRAVSSQSIPVWLALAQFNAAIRT
jgi:hypothetical protein